MRDERRTFAAAALISAKTSSFSGEVKSTPLISAPKVGRSSLTLMCSKGTEVLGCGTFSAFVMVLVWANLFYVQTFLVWKVSDCLIGLRPYIYTTCLHSDIRASPHRPLTVCLVHIVGIRTFSPEDLPKRTGSWTTVLSR